MSTDKQLTPVTDIFFLLNRGFKIYPYPNYLQVEEYFISIPQTENEYLLVFNNGKRKRLKLLEKHPIECMSTVDGKSRYLHINDYGFYQNSDPYSETNSCTLSKNTKEWKR